MISLVWKKVQNKGIFFWLIYIVILGCSVVNDLHFWEYPKVCVNLQADVR